MGIDHGGGGDKSPRIWNGETLMQIAPLPPRFCHICRLQKEHSVAFKIRQNPFPAVARAPDPAGGAHDAPPEARYSRSAGKGTPLPYLTPLGTDPPRCPPRVPQNSSQIYAYDYF